MLPDMPWFKVDDHFHSHPKTLATSPAALGLWVVAGSWAAANPDDGFVPAFVLPRLLPGCEPLADELVERRLWKRVKGGFQFRNWDEYQFTKDEIETKRKRDRDRQREYRQNKKRQVKPGSVTGESQRESQRDKCVSHRHPTQPNPTQPPEEDKSSSGTRKRATAIPEDYQPSDKAVAWQREKYPHIDADTETAKFINNHRGKGNTFKDHDAAWRNWIIKADEFDRRDRRHLSAVDDYSGPLDEHGRVPAGVIDPRWA